MTEQEEIRSQGDAATTDRPFRPQDHIMALPQGKKDRDGNQVTSKYLEAKWRVEWFREHHPEAVMEIVEKHIDWEKPFTVDSMQWNEAKRRKEKIGEKTVYGFAYYVCRVTQEGGGSCMMSKTCSAAEFEDFVEKSETGAYARCLAGLGYGTAGALLEEDIPADAPVTPAQGNRATTPQRTSSEKGRSAAPSPSSGATASSPVTEKAPKADTPADQGKEPISMHQGKKEAAAVSHPQEEQSPEQIRLALIEQVFQESANYTVPDRKLLLKELCPKVAAASAMSKVDAEKYLHAVQQANVLYEECVQKDPKWMILKEQFGLDSVLLLFTPTHEGKIAQYRRVLGLPIAA